MVKILLKVAKGCLVAIEDTECPRKMSIMLVIVTDIRQ